MTVGARLGVDVCNVSCGCEGNEKGRNSGPILQWIHIGLGGGDLTCPGVWPGKGGVCPQWTLVVCSSGTCVHV